MRFTVRITYFLLLCFSNLSFSQIGESNIAASYLGNVIAFQDSVALAVVPSSIKDAQNCCFLLPANPVPIELHYFQASVSNHLEVDLKWETISEVNNDYFVVEHSTDGRIFLPILNVKGKGTSTHSNTYLAVHTQPVPNENFYRLRQVDFNGKYSYSSIDLVILPYHESTVFQIFPNPAKNQVTLQLKQQAQLSLIDLYGRVLYYQKVGQKAILDISKLQPGMYIFRIDHNGVSHQQRFIKQ